MIIGVLALQGSFSLHRKLLSDIDTKSVEIRKPDQLKEINGLIIPGGESTTLSLLLEEYKFLEPLKNAVVKGLPIWGTCAGAIILGHGDDLDTLGMKLIGVKVLRNGYGRQIDSFVTPLNIVGIKSSFRGIFIRAPRLVVVDQDATIVSSYKGEAVMASEKNILVTTFHPELTDDPRVHQYFINEMILSGKRGIMNNT